MTYIVYENKIGYPLRLNETFEFDDVIKAVRFSRAKAELYEEQGMTVDHFNGHDWVWYAVDLNDAHDKGILLQIFMKESPLGEILIPNEEYVVNAA